MTLNAMPDDGQLALAPLDQNVDHVRGSPVGRVIIEYGDYECPYSRQAFHATELAGQLLGGNVRFAFRHFPLTRIHAHALAAAAAAEAAARQGRFWDMHKLLFHRQKALEGGDLRGYAVQLGAPRPGPERQSSSRPARADRSHRAASRRGLPTAGRRVAGPRSGRSTARSRAGNRTRGSS